MLAKTWAMLLACITLASWAVWIGLGHASWGQWYMGAFPAAIAMGAIGFCIGHILDHPVNPHPKPRKTRLASTTLSTTEDVNNGIDSATEPT